jgi:hypothetical protein
MEQKDINTSADQNAQAKEHDSSQDAPLPPKAKESAGKTAATKPKRKSLKPNKEISKLLSLLIKYQVAIILLLIGGLLALTALRMLHYANPASDDARVQENLSKFKKIHIDQKTVQRIEQLKDSNVSAGTKIENNRTNPFSE